MREFDGPIGRVWRRMRFQRFLAALVWCGAAGLALAAAAVGVEKLGHPVPGAAWVPFALAAGVAVVGAALVALLGGPSRVDAAVAIDRAFHLNERLSTALTLPDDLRETPAGRALIADAVTHVKGLDVREKFGVQAPRRAWIPLLPAALAVGLLFAPEWSQRTARASKTAEAIDTKAVVQSTKVLSKRIAEQRKELEKNKQLEEAQKLLAEIEKAANEMAKAPPSEKDRALIKLNELADAVKERQQRLGNPDQINRQLQQLKEMATSGPGEEFAKELARGDFQKAANELKKLQEQLRSGKMSDADKKKLQQQLGEMKEQLQKLANLEERKKQLEEARKNGGLSQKQYEQEMAKLEQQSKDLQKLQQMAQQLAQAQQAMQQGDLNKAAQALNMGQQQLAEMAQQAQEMASLDAALAELQDAKNGMTGDAMNQLGQGLDGMNQLGLGGRDGNRPGNGLGRGRGRGDRPEAPDDTAAYSTRVKQQYGKGKAILEGFAPPNAQMKGESLLADQATIEAASGAAAEALTNQKIPKSIQKHVRGYYDQINKGK